MCKDAWECYASRNIFFLDMRWINLHQQQWLQARYSVVLSWGVYTSEFAASRQIYSLSYWNSPFIKIGHCYTFWVRFALTFECCCRFMFHTKQLCICICIYCTNCSIFTICLFSAAVAQLLTQFENSPRDHLV